MKDNTNQYELSVVVNSRPVTEYVHQGLVFVEGRANSSYELQIKNNSYERIMAIPSVDGLGVIDGKPAGSESPGYIIEPYQTLNIPGWKVDDNFAAEFQFGASKSSYSNRTGKGQKNVGVIGLMVFRPRPSPQAFINAYSFTSTMTGTPSPVTSGTPSPDWNTPTSGGLVGGSILMNNAMLGGNAAMRGIAIPSGGAASLSKGPVTQSLGTEYGDATAFQTTTTTFDKRDPDFPDALMAVYYDDAAGLEARGIILSYRNTAPQAFPIYTSSNTASNFAPPPAGWKR